MKIHSLGNDFRAGNAVVTIGTFDGVHLGHMAVISRLKERAMELGGECVVITFYPHPRQVLSGDSRPTALLCSPDEKRELLGNAGIDHLLVIDFDRELSMMEACQFIEKILVGKIGAKHLIVGFNHHFGRRGEGNFDTIRDCTGRFGITVEKVDSINETEGAVSSSAIRELLLAGNIEEANRMLGYSFFITGKVIEGKKLGRKLGFPTANILPWDQDKLIPPNGVYAVEVRLGNENFKGVLSIGTNPTVEKNRTSRSIEVNIFDFDRDIYGSELRVFLRHRLRDEMTFPSLEALKDQIGTDKLNAIAYLEK
ncbi:MAG TPA: bifunctional riboflavin kinase/FAD synthetase [Bacteroidales bacterium]|nr:bifunctional riboflavin kinase/FAD synthetase [Bacteroidales bacterium]